jgi:hypothetical protein
MTSESPLTAFERSLGIFESDLAAQEKRERERERETA